MAEKENITSRQDVPEEEKEIDILELGIRVWSAKKRIGLWGLIGAVVGLIIGLSIPAEYTATVKLVPESGDAKNNNLGALASFAGINVGTAGGGDAVYPNLYPDIVSSAPFVTSLFNVKLPVEIEGADSLTLEQILTENTSTPWWSGVMSLPGKAIGAVLSAGSSRPSAESADSISDGVNAFRLTPEQSAVMGKINERISANYDSKTSVVTIAVTMQDPLAAACLADTVALRLQDYIKDYRTGKARNDLAYAEKINGEAREEYYRAQQEYARFVDRNQGLANRTASIEQERLQNEMNLAYNLYTSTSQQVQMAQAKVQSTTPVFAVVEPARVPNKPSAPRRFLILVVMAFLGIAGGTAWSLFMPGLRSSIKEKKQSMSTPNNTQQ